MVLHRGTRKSFFDPIKPISLRRQGAGADAPDEAAEREALFWDEIDDHLHPKR